MGNSTKILNFVHFWYSSGQDEQIRRQISIRWYCTIHGKKIRFTEFLATDSPNQPVPHGLWDDYEYLGHGDQIVHEK